MNKPVPDNAIEIIRNIGANGLPDNPSRNGFGAKQVKNAINRPSTTLADWLLKTQDILVGNGIPKVVGENESLPSGSTVEEGTIVLKIVDGRLKCYVYSNNYAHEISLEEPDAFTTIPGTLPAVKAAKFADKALNDINGNPIASTYCPSSYIVAYATRTDGAIETINGQITTANGQIDTINGQITAINTLLHSDDLTLDTVQEIVDYIKTNKNLVDYVLSAKVDKDDIVDNLTTNDATKVLSAKQGKVLNEKFEGLDEEIDGKIQRGAGERDGTLISGKADAADNLTPYSDESGSEQSKPFVAHGTATDNGTAEVAVAFAQLKEKQGNAVAWNQLIYGSLIATGTINGVTFTRNSDGTITVSGTSTDRASFNANQLTALTNGHWYLVTTVSGMAVHTTGWEFNEELPFSVFQWQAATGTANIIYDVLNTGVSFNNATFLPLVIDLTQLFPDNTPTSVTDPRVLWAIQYATLHPAYNAGSLIDGDGVKLACSGRNLLKDEISVSGDNKVNVRVTLDNPIRIPMGKPICISASTTAAVPFIALYNGEKNLGEVFLNQTGSGRNYGYLTPTGETITDIQFFYNGNDGSSESFTYRDITISLWYASGQDYDEYFPYEEPKVYDTGNEVLRSASVEDAIIRDSKDPSGLITRKVATYTFNGTEGYGWDSDGYWYCYVLSSDAMGVAGKITLTNGIVVRIQGDHLSIRCYTSDNPQITSSTNMREAIPSGTKFNYGLVPEQYTTEQGTPFPENISVNDYGMMTWLKADGTYAEIPQGAKFFYPADYKGMLDDIYYRCDPAGNANDLVVQSELSASETARDAVDAQLKEALGGTLRQLLAATKSIDFADTAWVDLGTLNWGYSENRFYADLQGAKPSAVETAGNILCSAYKTLSANDTYSGYKGISIDTGARLWVKDTAYNDAATFKAAMKGVLLAYEKASE